MLKKALVFSFLLIFVMGIAYSQPVIPKLLYAPTTPVIDGILNEWNFIPSLDFNANTVDHEITSFTSNEDGSGRFMWMWDDDYLYIALDVTDDEPGINNGDWRWDGAEIAMCEFDIGDALHGEHHDWEVWDGPDSLETKITIYYDATTDTWSVTDRRLLGGDEIPDVLIGAVITETGYVGEFAIPWFEMSNGIMDFFPEEGTRFTFDVMITDADSDSSQTGLIYHAGGINWPTDLWMPCDVVGRDTADVASSYPYLKKVMGGKEPVIDGNLDDWAFDFPIQINSTTAPYDFPAEHPNEDGNGIVRMMWDDENLYLALDAVDDVPGMFSDTYWGNDGVEIMACTEQLDPDSSHTYHHDWNRYDQEGHLDAKIRMAYDIDNDEWRFHEEWYLQQTEDDLDGDRAYVQTDDGYIIEASIPWETLESWYGFNWDIAEGRRICMFWGLADLDIRAVNYEYQGEMHWLAPIDCSWNWDTDKYAPVDVLGTSIIEDPDQLGVGVETDDSQAPLSLSLGNYPNPFNPVTHITFTLDKDQIVELSVYNALGQKLATLINNQKMSAGSHVVPFDANNLTSGIYLYKLTNDEGINITKKMTLLR
jgi:hypothetical protein